MSLNESELRSLLEQRIDINIMEPVYKILCMSYILGEALQETDDEMKTCVQTIYVALLRTSLKA